MTEEPLTTSATLRDVLNHLANSKHGLCAICDNDKHILGVLTDGDCRRALLRGITLDSPAREAMQTQFLAVDQSFTTDQIRLLMKTNDVEQVPIVDDAKRFLSIVSKRVLEGGQKERVNPVLILAGGKGRRLGDLTKNLPKPMLPIGGKPMIEHLIVQLVKARFTEIYISVNYLSEKIEQYFGDGNKWACQIKYLHEDVELGSGGPLSLLNGIAKHPVLVVNGDLVTAIDFGSFIECHKDGGWDLTIGVTNYEVPVPFGVVTIRPDGSVESILEKPVNHYPINSGIYLVDPRILALTSPKEFAPMTAVIEKAMAHGMRIGAFMIHEVWNDVGLPAVYSSLANQPNIRPY